MSHCSHTKPYRIECKDCLSKAAQQAIEETNLCMLHMEYHGQQTKECTPQKRIMVEIG